MTKQTENGQKIAERFRKLLFNIDLKIAEAEGQIALAEEEFKLHQKIRKTDNQRIAMNAKMNKECYKVFVSNLKIIKEKILKDLDRVLSTYTSKYKKIWMMYFIGRRSIEEISNEVNYSRDNINRIIKKMKDDLNINFNIDG